MTNKRTIYWGLFALLFFAMGYVHQKKFDAPTPVSRLDINPYHLNTLDKAKFEGKYFSDKVPGTVTLAFLPFAISYAVLAIAGIDLDSEIGWGVQLRLDLSLL